MNKKIKILIITQTVDKNDPILGFFHRWIEEFAKHFDSIIVVCLKEGEHHLPGNVSVFSLGKEDLYLQSPNPIFNFQFSIFNYARRAVARVMYVARFYRFIWTARREYDAVFVHMNPEYVVLGGAFWRVWGKKISLWYVHKSVTALLRVAVFLTNHVFTTSVESFRVKTRKRLEVGHGIDVEQFTRYVPERGGVLRILTIGRMSATKCIAEMIDVVEMLNVRGRKVLLTVVGEPVTALDREYTKGLRSDVEKRALSNVVKFTGAIPHDSLPEILHQADVFLNLSRTGSMDKAVLEAFASGVPAVSSNEAFRSILEPMGLFVSLDSTEEIADAVERAGGADTEKLVAYVREHHALPNLISKIARILSSR